MQPTADFAIPVIPSEVEGPAVCVATIICFHPTLAALPRPHRQHKRQNHQQQNDPNHHQDRH